MTMAYRSGSSGRSLKPVGKVTQRTESAGLVGCAAGGAIIRRGWGFFRQGGLHQKAHGCCRWSSRWSVVVHDERDRCPVLRSVRWSWSGETPGWSSDREPSPGTSPDGSGCGTSARTTPTGTRTSASLEDLDARRPDIVVLPDVPYRFRACDGPEMFPGRRQRPGPGPQATAVGQPGVAAPCTARHYVKPPFVPAETGSAPVGSLS